MKNKFVLTSLILLFYAFTFAQNPGMSYQAVIRNSDGQLLANQQVAATIKVRLGSTDVFNQTYQVNTNAHGLLTVNFADPVFLSLNWQNATMSCEVRQGNSVFLAENFQPVVAVPLSLYATSMNRDTLHTYLETDGHIISLRNALHDSITELRNGFINTETDPLFTAWDKSVGISITESQISDLGDYLESETQNLEDVLTLNNSAGNKNITNLANPVNPQDILTKAYVDSFLARIVALEEAELLNHGYTDSRDGNHYNVVKIGTQLWMAENLKYLPSVVGPDMESYTTPYYYVYDYNSTDVTAAKATENYETYGVLYNWAAAMAGSVSSSANPSGVQGVCPTGWHLPSDAEWTQLMEYLGGTSVAGGKLKESDTTHWDNPNIGATNEYGFSALPGGWRTFSRTFDKVGIMGKWWSATEHNSFYVPYYAWGPSISNDHINTGLGYTVKNSGWSVRCVKD